MKSLHGIQKLNVGTRRNGNCRRFKSLYPHLLKKIAGIKASKASLFEREIFKFFQSVVLPRHTFGIECPASLYTEEEDG
jgi:hypothetical protein